MVPAGRRPRCRHDYPKPVRAGVFDPRMKTVCRLCGRIKLTKAVPAKS